MSLATPARTANSTAAAASAGAVLALGAFVVVLVAFVVAPILLLVVALLLHLVLGPRRERSTNTEPSSPPAARYDFGSGAR